MNVMKKKEEEIRKWDGKYGKKKEMKEEMVEDLKGY